MTTTVAVREASTRKLAMSYVWDSAVQSFTLGDLDRVRTVMGFHASLNAMTDEEYDCACECEKGDCSCCM